MASNTGHIVKVMVFMKINENYPQNTYYQKKPGLIQIRMTLDHRKVKYED